MLKISKKKFVFILWDFNKNVFFAKIIMLFSYFITNKSKIYIGKKHFLISNTF